MASTISQELMKAETVAVGQKLFIEDDVEEWIEAAVTSQQNTLIKVKDSKGREQELDLGFSELHKANDQGDVDDMTSLEHLHEAAILSNLRTRILTRTEPYTFMGTVLVAVNPLKAVPSPEMEAYKDAPYGSAAPHPYAPAELAYVRLCDPRPDATSQSVVVSGESGSGKTESAKIVIKYLSWRGGGGEQAAVLATQLGQLNPVLESFGNAATSRNKNSSRFGRFLKLRFDKGELAAAQLETYLLEKSRVCRQAPGETSFHAMQYVATVAQKAALLEGAACLYVPNKAAGSREAEFKEADLGISAIVGETGSEAWKVLGGVMRLGDLTIGGDDKAAVTRVDGVLAALCQCLSLPAASAASDIAKLIELRTIGAGGEKIATPRNPVDAARCRDALARWLYAKCFDSLVAACNTQLKAGCDSGLEDLKFIGILDVFGFESFKTNGFETLLINLANESLQQHFCDGVFLAELDLFHQEDIEAPEIGAPPDSSATLELLAAKQGVLPLLDEQCATGSSGIEADAKFLSKLHAKTHHPSLGRTHPKQRLEIFTIKHFAGPVQYTVVPVSGATDCSWSEANVDAVPDAEFAAILTESSSGWIKDLGGLVKKHSKKTVSGEFWGSMVALREVLDSTDCAFIRCVKPTPEMVPGKVDAPTTTKQLRALGLVAACEVLRVALPTRLPYVELLAKLPASARAIVEDEPPETAVACALGAFQVDVGAYRLGKTRCFFAASALSKVHALLGFDAEKEPERAKEIEARLVEFKDNSVEARADARKAAEAVERAWAATKAAQEALGDHARTSNSSIVDQEASRKVDDLRDCIEALKKEAGLESTIASLGAKAEAVSSLVKKGQAARLAAWETSRTMDGTLQKCKTGAKEAAGLAAKVESASAASAMSIKKAAELESTSNSVIASLTEAAKTETDYEAVKNEVETDLKAAYESLKTAIAARIEAAEKAEEARLEAIEVARKAEEAALAKLAAEEAAKIAKLKGEAAAAAKKAEEERLAKILADQKAAEEKAAKEAADEEKALKEAAARLDAEEKAAEETRVAAAAAAAKKLLDNKKSMLAKQQSLPTLPTLGEEEHEGWTVAKPDSSIRATRRLTEVLAQADLLEEEDEKEEAVVDMKTTPTPAGWEAHALDGRMYYFNLVSGETQWELPTAPASSCIPSYTKLSEAQMTPKKKKRQSMGAFQSGVATSDQAYKQIVRPRRASIFHGPSSMRRLFKSQHSLKMVAELPPPVPASRRDSFSSSALAVLASRGTEGYLMMQSRWTMQWKARWFVLEDSYLEFYDRKRDADGNGGERFFNKNYRNTQLMKLNEKSTTSFTDTKNCFCVTTNGTSWFIVAPNVTKMGKWVAAINAHIIEASNSPPAPPFPPSDDAEVVTRKEKYANRRRRRLSVYHLMNQ